MYTLYIPNNSSYYIFHNHHEKTKFIRIIRYQKVCYNLILKKIMQRVNLKEIYSENKLYT